MKYKEFFSEHKKEYSKNDIPSLKNKKERNIFLENTRKLTKQILNERKLRIFDFDDTLVRTNSKIHVERPGGKKFSLTTSEFAVYEPKGDEKFDYSDFGKLVEPKKIKKYNELFKRIVNAAGKRKVTILTARGAQQPIREYLKMIGMEGKVNIVALADRRPEAKKRYVKTMIEHGYDDIFFIDDSKDNVRAVKSLKKEFPHIKMKAKVAKL